MYLWSVYLYCTCTLSHVPVVCLSILYMYSITCTCGLFIYTVHVLYHMYLWSIQMLEVMMAYLNKIACDSVQDFQCLSSVPVRTSLFTLQTFHYNYYCKTVQFGELQNCSPTFLLSRIAHPTPSKSIFGDLRRECLHQP
jgi:hypothetical protein